MENGVRVRDLEERRSSQADEERQGRKGRDRVDFCSQRKFQCSQRSEKPRWGKKALSSPMPSPGCAAELAIAAGEGRTRVRAEREQPLPMAEAQRHGMLPVPRAEGATGAAAGGGRKAEGAFQAPQAQLISPPAAAAASFAAAERRSRQLWYLGAGTWLLTLPHSANTQLALGMPLACLILTVCLGQLLEITPSPSVYRLTSKDDQDLEMCLITDYSPEKLTLNSAEQHTSAVVEVATPENREESSYLSTYWARRDKLQCGASHEGFGELEGEDPESGASAVCFTGLSPHFRTDEHLNTLSLSQLGLKIVLMKGMIFNVLMTMLLWKRKKD